MVRSRNQGTRRSAADAATRDDLIEAEREIGRNIPNEMIGLDTEDVGDVDLPSRAADGEPGGASRD